MNWRAYLEDTALSEFAAIEEGGRRILAKRDLREWARSLESEPEPGAARPARTVGGGRAEHPVVSLPDGGQAVLRRYHRGGLLRHLNRDRYFTGHRAFEELRATERARSAGVRVPEVLAAMEWRRGWSYGALLATRWIEESESIERWMVRRSPQERLGALRSAGEQIGRMHAGGIAHPDLNLRNLLVATRTGSREATVHLLDFDRARLSAGPASTGRRSADLRRLARSARKLGVPFSTAEWAAIRDGYGAEWPFSPSESP